MSTTPSRTRSRTPRGARRFAPALMCMALGLTFAAGTGCAGKRDAPAFNADLVRQADSKLSLAVAATRSGNLDDAERYSAEARQLAQTPDQTVRAQSMDQLLAGARAMSAGDAAGAGRCWARIRDRKLRQEVTVLADRMGIDVPVVVAATPNL